MATGRKKPISLEWQGSILSSGEVPLNAPPSTSAGVPGAANASLKSAHPSPPSETAPTTWKGKLRVRREVKGRGGHPAFVLYEFAPGASELQIKELGSALRSSLGCGGSAEGSKEIVVISQEWERLKKVLEKKGIAALESGGF